MADDKLIFPIGFDLEEGVRQVQKDWKKHQPEIQKTIDRNPLKLKLELSAKGFNISELKKYIGLSKEIAKANREIAKTRSANALAAQRESRQRVQEATELDQIKQKKAQAALTEERLTQAKQRSTAATQRQNAAYKTQGGYLSRLFQRMVAYASVAQAFSFVRNIRDVTAEFELQRVALGSIIGDLNEANAMFEQIKAAAVKSPFQIKELVTYTKQLAAYKIESDELFETTQRLADISAGLGVGMERLVLAYGQIRATGYLRASEVRQLTEAGIPIVEELAKKMSQLRGETVSAAEVMGLISERAISFGEVKEVFDDMTSAGGMFYKMQEKQAETLAGQWSNLQDSIAIMYDEIGNTESVNNTIKDMIGLIKSLAENWRVVGNVAVWSVGAALGYAKVIKPISELVKKQDLLKKSSEAYAKSRKALHLFMQTGDKDYQREYQWQLRIARSYRQSVNAAKGFGGALKSIGSFIKANWVGMLITAVTALVSWLISARQEANRLKKELAKIGAEGALQADQSVRNFERLASAIRESADGSSKQTEALEEMKRAYGEFLPSQDKSIINLVREKDGYNAVTQAIREKIALQIQEQKLNTIVSEYGSKITKKETQLKDWLTGEDWRSVEHFPQEEAIRIINAIRQAVSDGLISADKDWAENAKIIRKLSFAQSGLAADVEESGIDRIMYEEYINVLYDMNDQIRQVEISMESATSTLGRYTQAYKDFKEELKDATGIGEKFSFEWNESKTKAEIKAYNEFIGDLLAKEGIKFDIGEAIDFKGLYEALGDNYPQLKQVVAKIQGEYEKLVPKDLEKLIKEQFSTLATKYGASLDKLQHYFKSADQSTQDWVKTLKDAKTELGNQIFDAKKLDKDTTALEAQKQVIEAIITAWDNSEKTQKAGAKSAEQALKDELAAVEKIYKRYQDLRNLKSETGTQSILANEFEGVSLTTLSKAYSPKQMIEVYQKALAEAQRLGKKDLVLEIQTKLGEFNVDEGQRKLEKKLKDLSDQISRTKTAKEFFDRMLGLTGDKQLSASLTVSLYGGEMGDDLGDRLAKDMATRFQEQVQTYFGDIDISSAINKATGEIDPINLEKLLTDENVEKMGKDNAIEVRKIINDLIKSNADYATELFKSYEKFFDYEKRMTMVTQREEEKRKKIRESMIPDDQKAQLEDASKKREQEQISAIEIEQLKDTADWEKTFEDLNNLGSLTVKNLISLLEEYIAKKKEAGEPIAESDMKTLMNELNQLRERDAQLDPFATIKASLKDLTDATKEYSEAKKDGDEEGMANAQNKRAKALKKLETAVNEVASGFQHLSNILTEFQELLGIEDDSAMGDVFNAAAKALGFVAMALSTAIALTLLWNSTLWANPLFAGVSIVSGVLGAIAGVFSVISNSKVRKANKEIEKQQKVIDRLEYSYGRLEKEKEKALGSEYVSNYQDRLKNLQAQESAYLKQAEAERSKGKKADKDKIKEYEDAARDTADEIKDMQDELKNYFLGTDITSAARDFAESWIDAYMSFGSTADAIKDKFKDMIKNIIIESLAAKVIRTALEDVYAAVDQYSPNGISVEEAAQLVKLTEVAAVNAEVGMTNLMNALEAAGINIRGASTDLTGISKDIASASEESILGLAAGINTQNFYISQIHANVALITKWIQSGGMDTNGYSISDLVTMQNQHLSNLPNIASNTAGTLAECRSILLETRRIADNLDRVIKPRDVKSSYTLNTSL